MGKVYNQEEKGDQSRLGFSLWWSVYKFSFVVSTIFLVYLFKAGQNKWRVRKVSGTGLDG